MKALLLFFLLTTLHWPGVDWPTAFIDSDGDGKADYVMEINPWNMASAEGLALLYYDGSFHYRQNLSNIVQENPSAFVHGYPEVYIGSKPWNNNWAGDLFPLPATSLPDLEVNLSYRLLPGEGPLNWALEFWLVKDPYRSTGVESDEVEVMVWLYNQSLRPAGEKVGEVVITVNGTPQAFEVWRGHIGWEYIAFLSKEPIPEGEVVLNLREVVEIAREVSNRESFDDLYIVGLEVGSEFGSPSTRDMTFGWDLWHLSITPIPESEPAGPIAAYLPLWTSVDPSLLENVDRVNVAFFSIAKNGSVEPSDADALEQLLPLLEGKEAYMAIGGENSGEAFRSLADGERREAFLSSIEGWMDTFDGVVIDWEFPVCLGGGEGDAQLLLDLAEGLHNRSIPLSIALAPSPQCLDPLPLEELSSLAIIELMAYNFHGSWSDGVSFTAPLPEVEGALSHLLERVPPSRVYLGLPLYGYRYTGEDLAIGSPYQSLSHIPYREAEGVAYPTYWDSYAMASYKLSEGRDVLIAYDNLTALSLKAALAREEGLAGLMLWELSMATPSAVEHVRECFTEGLCLSPPTPPSDGGGDGDAGDDGGDSGGDDGAGDDAGAGGDDAGDGAEDGSGGEGDGSDGDGGEGDVPFRLVPSQVTYRSDWGKGFCVDVNVENPYGESIRWATEVELPFPYTITSLWNARQEGDHFVGEDWNAILPPQGETTFGFCGERNLEGMEREPLPWQLTVTSDWGEGYCVEVRVENPSNRPVAWRVELEVNDSIESLWSARREGDTFVGEDWNAILPPQSETTFGFCASR